MSSISIDDSPASMLMEAVNSFPRVVDPSVDDRPAMNCECGWSGTPLFEPPLQLIPKGLNVIMFCTERESQGMVRMLWCWRKSCVT